MNTTNPANAGRLQQLDSTESGVDQGPREIRSGSDLTSDLSLLVRQEIELAKAELAQKGRTVAPGLVAYVLVRQGNERVTDAGKPVPEQTIETVKEDVEWAKTRASSARR
jgi:hypothetical protein